MVGVTKVEALNEFVGAIGQARNGILALYFRADDNPICEQLDGVFAEFPQSFPHVSFVEVSFFYFSKRW